MYSKIFTATFMQVYIAYNRLLLVLFENTLFICMPSQSWKIDLLCE